MPFHLKIVDKVVTLVGRRNSGKSEMMKFLVDRHRHVFNKVFVVSYSDFNGFWKNKAHIPEENIFHHFSQEWMDQLLKKMEHVNKNKTKENKDFKRVLLVLDDVMNDVKAHNPKEGKGLRVIAGRGRHLGVSILVSCQFYTQVPPQIRNNSDLLFFGKNNRASLELLEEEVNSFMDKKAFVKLVSSSTDEYNFFVVDQTAQKTKDVNEVFGVFKVPNFAQQQK